MANPALEVGRTVTYKKASGKLRPAVITAIGSTNGGVILRVGHHSETYGTASVGILERVDTTSNATNVYFRW